MPYTYAQAQCIRLRRYFDVLHRGMRGPLDPVCVRAIIVQRQGLLLPRSPNGLFKDCPPPAPAEAAAMLYEIVLLSTPCLPGYAAAALCTVTLADHCRAYETAF